MMVPRLFVLALLLLGASLGAVVCARLAPTRAPAVGLASRAPAARMSSPPPQPDPLVPELSRRFPTSRLAGRNRDEVIKVVATAEECAAVALRLEIPTLHALIARCTLRRAAGDTVAVRGNLTADVTQRCVLTDEDFRSSIRATFASILHPDEASLASGGGLVGSEVVLAFDPESDEAVDEDVLDEPGVVDVGELVTQYLSLHVEQFPRRPGAVFEDYFESDASGAQTGFTVGDMFPALPPDGLAGS